MKPAEEEQKEIIAKHGSSISMEALNNMTTLHRYMQEAVRLHPPLILLLRYVHRAFTVTDSKGKSFYIPKVTLHMPHRLSSFWQYNNVFNLQKNSAIIWPYEALNALSKYFFTYIGSRRALVSISMNSSIHSRVSHSYRHILYLKPYVWKISHWCLDQSCTWSSIPVIECCT